MEAALALLPDRAAPLRLLDFGTGSGCLLLALLSELPTAIGIGIDILPGAAQIARRNAAALGLGKRALFAVGSWGETISGEADVIVANPPYIATADDSGHWRRKSPATSRVLRSMAASDGLAAYRELAVATWRLLAPGGIALFEVGAGRHADVAAVLGESGLELKTVKCDLSGIPRCVVVAKSSPVDRATEGSKNLLE